MSQQLFYKVVFVIYKDSLVLQNALFHGLGMDIQIVFGDYDEVLPINLDPQVQQRLIELVLFGRTSHADRLEFSRMISESIAMAVDVDLGRPSKKQIDFARDIARELQLQMAPKVAQDRSAMNAFLSKHTEAFRSRRKARIGSAAEKRPSVSGMLNTRSSRQGARNGD